MAAAGGAGGGGRSTRSLREIVKLDNSIIPDHRRGGYNQVHVHVYHPFVSPLLEDRGLLYGKVTVIISNGPNPAGRPRGIGNPIKGDYLAIVARAVRNGLVIPDGDPIRYRDDEVFPYPGVIASQLGARCGPDAIQNIYFFANNLNRQFLECGGEFRGGPDGEFAYHNNARKVQNLYGVLVARYNKLMNPYRDYNRARGPRITDIRHARAAADARDEALDAYGPDAAKAPVFVRAPKPKRPHAPLVRAESGASGVGTVLGIEGNRAMNERFCFVDELRDMCHMLNAKIGSCYAGREGEVLPKLTPDFFIDADSDNTAFFDFMKVNHRKVAGLLFYMEYVNIANNTTKGESGHYVSISFCNDLILISDNENGIAFYIPVEYNTNFVYSLCCMTNLEMYYEDRMPDPGHINGEFTSRLIVRLTSSWNDDFWYSSYVFPFIHRARRAPFYMRLVSDIDNDNNCFGVYYPDLADGVQIGKYSLGIIDAAVTAGQIAAPAPAAFGPVPAPAAFGPVPAPAAFGPGPAPAAFGPGPAPAAFGPGPAPAAFGPAPAAFGHVPAAFGPAPAPAAFGPAPAPAAFRLAPAPAAPAVLPLLPDVPNWITLYDHAIRSGELPLNIQYWLNEINGILIKPDTPKPTTSDNINTVADSFLRNYRSYDLTALLFYVVLNYSRNTQNQWLILLNTIMIKLQFLGIPPWGLDYRTFVSPPNTIKSGLYLCFARLFNLLTDAQRTGNNYFTVYANVLSANYGVRAGQPILVAAAEVAIPNLAVPEIMFAAEWNSTINPVYRGGGKKSKQTKRRLSKKRKTRVKRSS